MIMTTQDLKNYFSDLLTIANTCATCKRETCREWCRDFTRAQIRECDEHATAKPYEKIYC